MKTGPLVALLLVLTAVAVVLFLVTEGGPEGDGGPAPVVVGPGGADRGRAALGTEGAEDPPPLEGDAELRTAAAGAPEAVPAGGWLEGVVLRVPGVDDPELAVLAAPPTVELYGPALRNADTRTVTVGPDGRFRVPLDEGHGDASLFVRGRYLYTGEGVRATPTEPVTLSPSVGACLVVDLELPADATPEERAACRVKVTGTFGQQSRTGMMDQRGVVHLSDLAPDEEGRVTVRALPPDRNYFVHVDHPRFASARADVDVPPAGVDTRVPLALHRGGTVVGLVVDQARQPVAEADVTAQMPARFFGLDGDPARTTKTDAEGRFELQGVPLGAMRVRATAPGYLPSAPARVDVTEGSRIDGVRLELDRGNRIAGVVLLPDGTPADDLRVEVEFDRAHMSGMEALNAMRGADGEARTDERGRFEVTGLGKGPFVVSAAWRPEDRPPLAARAEGVKPGTEGLELRLAPPVGLAGTVVDEAGAPVPEFDLFLRRQVEGGMSGMLESRQQHVTSDAGRFFVGDLVPGGWKVWVTGPTHATPAGIPVEVRADAEDVQLVAPRGAVVRGRVTEPGGATVGEATVAPGGGAPTLAGLTEGGPQPPSARTGTDGTFELAPLPAGPITISAASAGWSTSEPLPLDLRPGEVLEGVQLTLALGGNLTGEVYDAEGNLAAGRMVMAMGTNALTSGGLGQRMRMTDARGTFAFDHLTPGSWQVIAMDNTQDWGSDGELDVSSVVSGLKMTLAEVREGETTHVVLGAPPSDPVRVQGRVTMGGQAVEKCMLTFHREGQPLMTGMTMTSADPDGRYEVELPEPGKYLVQVQQVKDAMQQSSIEYQVDVAEEREQRLDFALPLGVLAGRVVGPDGAAAAGERVTLTMDGAARSDRLWGQYTETRSEEDGRFEIRGLREGTYRLSAGGGGPFGGGKLGRVTTGDLHLDEGEGRTDLVLRLPRPGSLAIEVRDAAGAPVPGATVFVRDASGRSLEPLSLVATDGSGRCVYEGLAPGEVTVLARTSTLACVEAGPVRVAEGQRAAVELQLEEGAILLVSLKERDGDKAPVSATVSVTDEHGREISTLIGMNDLQHLYGATALSESEYRVGPVAPGKYTVVARAGELSATKLVTVRGGEGVRKLTLRLR